MCRLNLIHRGTAGWRSWWVRVHLFLLLIQNMNKAVFKSERSISFGCLISLVRRDGGIGVLMLGVTVLNRRERRG